MSAAGLLANEVSLTPSKKLGEARTCSTTIACQTYNAKEYWLSWILMIWKGLVPLPRARCSVCLSEETGWAGTNIPMVLSAWDCLSRLEMSWTSQIFQNLPRQAHTSESLGTIASPRHPNVDMGMFLKILEANPRTS
jgi:hypothetical protein